MTNEMTGIEVIQYRSNGTPSAQRFTNLCQLDETLQALFNIGAKKITIQYEYSKTEYVKVPKDSPESDPGIRYYQDGEKVV